MLRDLKTNTCRPYRKPNNTPSYIHMSSNYPPEILKRLPTSISELLSLKKSGYQASPEYIEPKVDNIENNTNKLKRKRKIIWFNRPFNKVLQPI